MFDKLVVEKLTEMTGYPAYACPTGIGDWSNSISGDNIIKEDFFADTGMVCVCRLTDNIVFDPFENYTGMAVFEMSENVKVELNRDDKDWTVVIIVDDLGNFVSSEYYNRHIGDDYDDYDDYE